MQKCTITKPKRKLGSGNMPDPNCLFYFWLKPKPRTEMLSAFTDPVGSGLNNL